MNLSAYSCLAISIQTDDIESLLGHIEAQRLLIFNCTVLEGRAASHQQKWLLTVAAAATRGTDCNEASG